VAAQAEGVRSRATAGRAYLDAAAGAIVVDVGYGRQSVVDAMARQASAFTRPARSCGRDSVVPATMRA
jgi:adenosylmethionine-8-amino-7-oxononanoate aminotransferase